jgi:hypothetical protein
MAMLAGGFGIAIGVGWLSGINAEGPLMILAGPLLTVFDLAYRRLHPRGRWFYHEGGGALFYAPVWMFGLLWLGLGIAYTIQNPP